MNFSRTAVFWCVVICWSIAALADREESGEEMRDDGDVKMANETSSVEAGPPDSHEAMNNRDVIPKVREKRSFEFLMGLINNNSRYEITRVDPSLATEKPKVQEGKLAASELLLELMVRIAAHPQQWEKVHKLLQKLDRDLTASKSIVNKLQTHQLAQDVESKEDIYVNKKLLHNDADSLADDEPRQVFDRRKNDTTVSTLVYDKELTWPTFDKDEPEVGRVKFVNNSKMAESHQAQNKSTKVTYPKNFSYHRVTGRPIYLNKNPRAYIAVSAAKSTKDEDDDVALENELHQLKPWSHSNNLKNPAAPVAPWVIRTEAREKPVVPIL